MEALRAVLINRMHVLRDYAKQVTAPVCREQLRDSAGNSIRAAKRLLVREAALLDGEARQRLRDLLATNAALQTVYEFRERLNELWSGAHTSNERLLQQLRTWIADAEASGVAVLQQYARSISGAAIGTARLRHPRSRRRWSRPRASSTGMPTGG